MESDVVDARKAGNDPTSDLRIANADARRREAQARIDEAKQRREEILACGAAQAQNEAEAPAQTPAARAGVRLVTDVTANGAELAG